MRRFNLALRLSCLLVLLSSAPALSQARPDLTRFWAFADPLIGTWKVRIRDLDEQGKVLWDDAGQTRSFSYTIDDEFLQELALVRSSQIQREIVTGMHLFSYDPKQNVVVQHGFWPGKSGLMFTAEVRLADDNRSAAGTISMPQDKGVRHQRRLEIKWVNEREFTYRAYGKDSAGREFLNEELVYSRAS